MMDLSTLFYVYGGGAAFWLLIEGFTLSRDDYFGVIAVRTVFWPASLLVFVGQLLRRTFR